MNNCQICGEPTKKPHYKLCLDCWKDQQQDNQDLNDLMYENSMLRARVLYLEIQLTIYKKSYDELSMIEGVTLSDSFKRKLKQLCHPDKHDGSLLANEVFKELNNL